MMLDSERMSVVINRESIETDGDNQHPAHLLGSLGLGGGLGLACLCSTAAAAFLCGGLRCGLLVFSSRDLGVRVECWLTRGRFGRRWGHSSWSLAAALARRLVTKAGRSRSLDCGHGWAGWRRARKARRHRRRHGRRRRRSLLRRRTLLAAASRGRWRAWLSLTATGAGGALASSCCSGLGSHGGGSLLGLGPHDCIISLLLWWCREAFIRRPLKLMQTRFLLKDLALTEAMLRWLTSSSAPSCWLSRAP